ncbi:hypothetical protein AcW1_005244 [Taiwanofungus camphoratus]|nr:hypothetical protein AcW2_004014 [Antrodia cinnamomea]KAI0956606.1 hypothetical protein AcW1_005244 [Antrodia cinnamomea]
MLADVLHPSPSAQSAADGIANNHPGTSMNGDDIYNVDDNTNLRIQVEDAFRGSGQLHRQQPQLEDEYTSQSPEEALRDQGRGSPPSYEGRFHKAVQPHLTSMTSALFFVCNCRQVFIYHTTS